MWKRWRQRTGKDEVAVEVQEPQSSVRSAERRMLYREAFLHLPMAVKVPVIALDISPLGARVRLTRLCRLPDQLFVTVLDEVKKIPAKVIWQDGADAGLEFINPDLNADIGFDSPLDIDS